MKTVEELAREAGLFHYPYSGTYGGKEESLERFRDLVLEEAVLEVYSSTSSIHDEADIVLKELIAEAIRGMKGQK